MSNLRKIIRRINSVQNTRQITNAMKMVATAKLQKAQKSIFSTRTFSESLDEILYQIVTRRKYKTSKLLSSFNTNKKLYVLVTADRGLCGGFNSNISKKLLEIYNNQKEDEQIEIVVIGRKGRDFFKTRKIPIKKEFINIFDRLSRNHAEQILNYIVELFLTGEYQEINILYNKFKSMLVQEIVSERFLPISLEENPESLMAKNDESQHLVDFTYDTSEEEIITAVLKEALKLKIWKILLESFSSEQAARRTAMESATDNASEMIRKLTIYKNRVRQAVITTEITEIVSGAEALKM